MHDTNASDTLHPVLGAVLRVMAPLVRWLLRSGVGYAEFTAAIKPVFLAEARAEVRRIRRKETDSALSLLSGLHRKDVRKAALEVDAQGTCAPVKASLASQVVARWVANALPQTLPLAGDQSFESLVHQVSRDVHPRSVQYELVRLGVAHLVDGQLVLLRQAFVPDPQAMESRQLLADSVADHLAAGVHNLTGDSRDGGRKYLEQALFADGLSQESVRTLEQLANELWHEAMRRMMQAAVPLCEHDEPLGGDQRLRLGMFCFAEPMAAIGEKAVENNEK